MVNRLLGDSILFAGLLSSCGYQDQQLQLRLAHVASPGSLVAASAEEFARRANQELDGLAHITVFGSSQLGDDETLLIKLKLGTVDLSVPSSIMSSVVESFGLFEMPFLVKDRSHMSRIEEAVIWPYLAEDAAEKGYQLLGIWENGYRHITNNLHPINVPADFAGIKLRTPRGYWRLRLFQELGANPTPMSLAETFMALQTGVIDGQENPLSQIHSQKFHEVQKFLTLSGHVYTPAYLVAGTERWSQLPARVREVLQKAAREVQGYVYQEAERLDSKLLDELATTGIEINVCDRDSIFQAGRPLLDMFAAEVPRGAEILAQALALAPTTIDANR